MKVQEVNTYVVISNKGQILVLKRDNGIWEFPGGGIEWGENPRETAIRETKEETGINVDELLFIGITSATYKKENKDKHSLYMVYLATSKEKDVEISKEHKEYRWLSISELKYLKLGLNAEPIPDLIEDLVQE